MRHAVSMISASLGIHFQHPGWFHPAFTILKVGAESELVTVLFERRGMDLSVSGESEFCKFLQRLETSGSGPACSSFF